MRQIPVGTRVEWADAVYGRATGRVTGLENRAGYVPVEPDPEFTVHRRRPASEGQFMVRRRSLKVIR